MPKIKKAVQKILADEIEEIRLNATSPSDLVVALQEFWLKYGLKVEFTDYPSSFSLEISNSHNSPRGYPQNWCNRNENAPRHYPGWSGNWRGTVTVLDSCTIANKGIYLSALTGAWSDSIMDVWYIQTGTGGGGDHFQYSGMLWLYDFPKMHEEFNARGGKVDILTNQYNTQLHEYRRLYEAQKDEYIDKNDVHIQGKKLLTHLSTLSNTLNSGLIQLKGHLCKQFNEQYDIPIPDTPYAFAVDQDLLKDTHIMLSEGSATPHPELQELFNSIIKTSAKVNGYLDEHPEFLF